MPNIRACIREGPGKVTYAEFAVPEPGPGQVLVRTTLTTICGSDIHVVEDFEMIPPGMPMGHESIGIVVAVGDGIEKLKVGDRIVAACLTSCGSCKRCDDDEPQVCSGMKEGQSVAIFAHVYDIFRRHADGIVKIALR